MSNDSSPNPRKSNKSSSRDEIAKAAPELDLWDLDDDEDENLMEPKDEPAAHPEHGEQEAEEVEKAIAEKQSVNDEDDDSGNGSGDPVEDALAEKPENEEKFPGEDWSIEDEPELRAKPVVIAPKPIKRKTETKKQIAEDSPVSKLETPAKHTSEKPHRHSAKPIPKRSETEKIGKSESSSEIATAEDLPKTALEEEQTESHIVVAHEKAAPEADNPGAVSNEESTDGPENQTSGITDDTRSPQARYLGNFVGSLSKMEKLGIAALLAILAMGAIYGVIHFTKSVPTKPLVAEKIDLPIDGKSLTIKELKTFWREPITTGENADVVRRDAVLIPVVAIEMEPSGSKAAVRILFRNEKGEVVGDNITREITGTAALELAATDGYHDIGMHASYRTGDSLPWSIQVFEAPRGNSPSEEFIKLIETEISTDVH
ncbi:hypothetical protein ACFSSA_15740 [Luteolibacter algae]|uniref:Uncharacterized protein n=1 Tax=Luteolibacter algae TaxID=454151 RepID=A0ABW5DAI1_9BACT